MNILDMHANFGKLNHSELHLNPGLNVIYANNETGKSTWAAFTADMFYGIPTKERSFTAHKNLFAPWNGSVMAGTLHFQSQGHDYLLSRNTGANGIPFGSCDLYYYGTNTSVPDLSTTDIGSHFLNSSRDVFERTAYIKQTAIHVDKNAELEKKISALVTTGEDDVSFSEAHTLLKKRMNKLNSAKSGEIPLIKEKMESLHAGISQLHSYQEEIRTLDSRIESLQSKLCDLSNEEYAISLREKLKVNTALESAKRARDLADEQLRELTTAWPNVSEMSLATLDNDYNTLYSLQCSMNELKQKVEKLNSDLLELQKSIAYHPLSPADSQEVLDALVHNIPKLRWGFMIGALIFLALCTLLIIFLPTNLPESLLPYMASFFVLCGILIVICERARYRKALSQNEVDQENAKKYLAMLSKQALLNESKDELSRTFQDHENNFNAHWRQFLTDLRYCGISNVKNALDAQDAIVKLTNIAKQLKSAAQRLQNAQIELNQVQQTISAENDAIVTSIRTLPEITDDRTATVEQIQSAYAARDLLLNKCARIGTVDQCTYELEQLTEKLAKTENELKSLQIAESALVAANTKLELLFAPKLSADTSEVFRYITDGKYNEVYLNKDFAVKVIESGDNTPRDLRFLSQGTIDQLYFSIRIALNQNIFPKDDPVPLIFDDAFVYFDDQRLSKILDYLLALSNQQQIVIFSCQKREFNYLKDKIGVTSIFLS